MQTITTAVSQNIKRIREQKKLTLDATAAVTGVSRSMLAQIEKWEANPHDFRALEDRQWL